MQLPLEYYAAIQGIHGLDSIAVRAIVDELTNDGIWDDDFVYIMDADPEVNPVPPFLCALGRLGVSVPSKEDAVWYLIDFHTARIARGDVEPLSGLERMIRDIYWDYDFGAHSTKYLGDSHGIEGLVGLYWSYDDWRASPWPSATVENFRDEALALARAWQARASR